MDNTTNLNLFLKSLDQAISQYEPTLAPLLSKTIDEHLAACATATAKIHFLNNFQYVLISTVFSYLKSLGVDTDQHPIKKELARVKSYMMRAKALEQNNHAHKDSAKREQDQQRAKDFIAQTLGRKSGDASTVSDVGPAISTQSFQGKHTRFQGNESDSEAENVAAAKGKSKSAPRGKVDKQHKGDRASSSLKSKISGKVGKHLKSGKSSRSSKPNKK
ncbi:uncharacterized protein LODBEIA_P02650 [Lodderomyces beijingensis]|uniref:Exosome complex protein n=1 Tax=Lodderomyces beijingensis TaxID=1775926 RepID=A0ABP0ZCY7_9ASCO